MENGKKKPYYEDLTHNTNYKCTRCSIGFPDDRKLTHHLRTFHSTPQAPSGGKTRPAYLSIQSHNGSGAMQPSYPSYSSAQQQASAPSTGMQSVTAYGSDTSMLPVPPQSPAFSTSTPMPFNALRYDCMPPIPGNATLSLYSPSTGFSAMPATPTEGFICNDCTLKFASEERRKTHPCIPPVYPSAATQGFIPNSPARDKQFTELFSGYNPLDVSNTLPPFPNNDAQTQKNFHDLNPRDKSALSAEAEKAVNDFLADDQPAQPSAAEQLVQPQPYIQPVTSSSVSASSAFLIDQTPSQPSPHSTLYAANSLSKKARKITCNQCSFSCSSIMLLNGHMKTHKTTTSASTASSNGSGAANPASTAHSKTKRAALAKATITMSKSQAKSVASDDDDGDQDYKPTTISSSEHDTSKTESESSDSEASDAQPLKYKSKQTGKKRRAAAKIEEPKKVVKKRKAAQKSSSESGTAQNHASKNGSAQVQQESEEDALAKRIAATQASTHGCKECNIPYYSSHSLTRHNRQKHSNQNRAVIVKKADNENNATRPSSIRAANGTNVTINMVNNFMGENAAANANAMAQVSAAVVNTVQGLNVFTQRTFTCNACQEKFTTEAPFLEHLAQQQACREHPLNNGGSMVAFNALASSQSPAAPVLAPPAQLTLPSPCEDASAASATATEIPAPLFPSAISNNPIALAYAGDLDSALLNDFSYYDDLTKASPFTSFASEAASLQPHNGSGATPAAPHSPYPKPNEIPQQNAAIGSKNDNK